MPYVQHNRHGRAVAILTGAGDPSYQSVGRTPRGRLILTDSDPRDVPGPAAVIALFAAVDSVLPAGGGALFVEWDHTGWWPRGSARPAIPWGARVRLNPAKENT